MEERYLLQPATLIWVTLLVCFYKFFKLYKWYQLAQSVSYLLLTIVLRGGSRTAATSKMELFVVIVNGWEPLIIITKWSILDVAAVLDLPLLFFCIYEY